MRSETGDQRGGRYQPLKWGLVRCEQRSLGLRGDSAKAPGLRNQLGTGESRLGSEAGARDCLPGDSVGKKRHFPASWPGRV